MSNMSRAKYDNNIKQLITNYNDESGSIILLLKSLHKLDECYFGSDSKKIIMSRHGQCGSLQKVLGANPNSGLEDSCKSALRAASINTAKFLRENKETRFISSPMRRSLQTASLLLPNNLSNTRTLQLAQSYALAENSEDLSGKNIKSPFDLIKHMVITLPIDTLKYMFTRKLSMPVRFVTGLILFPVRLLESLASLVTWAFLGHKLKGDMQQVDRNLSVKGFASEAPEKEASLSDSQKISAIDDLINETEQDLWLFGHGKNFKTYFNDKFDISESFDYADVRTMFKKIDGNFEAACYVLHVDQKTGAIVPKILNSALAAENNYSASHVDSMLVLLGDGMDLETGTKASQSNKSSEEPKVLADIQPERKTGRQPENEREHEHEQESYRLL